MITCYILIVDDDPDDIDLLRASFYEIGVKEIHGVFSMKQALEYLHSFENASDFPKIIITDLNMPGQNGYDLLKFLKDSQQYKHIPVIVCSTSVSGKEADRALAMGALDYIPKPVIGEDYIHLANKIYARIKHEF